DAGDLLRDIKSELLPEEVFVFTPKGDVINLPARATVIDFAYAIHSAVGNRMVGAKVNGRIVPIDHKVVTGEIIEVITGPKDKGPSRDWLSIVTTSEARNKIRNWFKKERKEENIIEGKAALEKELRRNLITISEPKYQEFIMEIARRQRLNSPDELYASIGYGGTQLSRLIVKIKEEYNKAVREEDPKDIFDIPIKKHKSSEGVIVEGIDNCLVKFAKCCNPLPGDEIVGFIT
ncbi:MAG: TGS domain-containing protein, partial [Oscillospiraceae bacterium]